MCSTALLHCVGLLRSLHLLYQALEQALQAAAPTLSPLPPGIARTPALAQVMHSPGGGAWPLQAACPAAQAYVDHLRALAAGAPKRLLAHVYVRYLGDLHGGQILQERVIRAYGASTAHAFYRFDQPARQIEQLRTLLDAETTIATMEAIVDEACDAFRRHIDLFRALLPPGFIPV